MKKINLLDHGFVRLTESSGDDLSIVRAARVSHNAAWRAGEDTGSDHRLINYLMKHRHTTPFEMVRFTFEVKAPIFVFRQWHRHRTWSYNEVSARYSELPEEFYVPKPGHIGVQSESSKQTRTISEETFVEVTNVLNMMRNQNQSSFKTYQDLLTAKVPRELARSVLPVATYSHMFASVDLHNLFHFLNLRLHPHAQYEIRVYAKAMLQLIQPIVPVACAAFETHTLDHNQETS